MQSKGRKFRHNCMLELSPVLPYIRFRGPMRFRLNIRQMECLPQTLPHHAVGNDAGDGPHLSLAPSNSHLRKRSPTTSNS